MGVVGGAGGASPGTARDDAAVTPSAESRPLLVVDGDSFAHRAYHALPRGPFARSGGEPGNALYGVATMLATLWQAEQPRAVVIGWDTLEVPTYRHTALPAYQSGREFDADILAQLPLLPALVEAMGFAAAKGPGFEADDFLAAAARAEEAAGGTALVATSDRDAFQLVTERVTILQPVRGVSELARIGPAEVRERYGVAPRQVPDFIALRGDPSDKIPGARGIGAKKAADLLREHDSLDALLAAGRFAAEAEDLLLYRRIATMDASAPLPPLNDQSPTWTEASTFARSLGHERLAKRLAELA
jgi:DNA polymerase-1